MEVFDSKDKVDYLAKSIPFEEIVANNYNLSVSSYVEVEDNREVVNIMELNAELKNTVTKIDQLRKKIDAIVVEIGSNKDSEVEA
jgi:Type I restriction-modification system methyltransferase subunit